MHGTLWLRNSFLFNAQFFFCLNFYESEKKQFNYLSVTGDCTERQPKYKRRFKLLQKHVQQRIWTKLSTHGWKKETRICIYIYINDIKQQMKETTRFTAIGCYTPTTFVRSWSQVTQLEHHTFIVVKTHTHSPLRWHTSIIFKPFSTCFSVLFHSFVRSCCCYFFGILFFLPFFPLFVR